MQDLISRVTVIAIGVNHYKDNLLEDLQGPENDVDQLRHLLVENSKTALYSLDKFKALYNPTANEFRELINRYTMDRSASGDILLLYFSGHGVPIGRDDFGFCTTDTIIHPLSEVALPLSIVKYSELLQTIYIADITPIIIIDACYSGIAGRNLIIPPIEIIDNLRQQIHSRVASKFSLLCSCSDYQISIDTPQGGVFSHYLFEVAREGISTEANKPLLSFIDIYPVLERKVQSYSGEATPRLFLGVSLPEFPLVINTQYSPTSYQLSLHLVNIVKVLWDDGNKRELSPSQIDDECGRGAYGNHRKLSYTPWGLIEDNPQTGKRHLTERGIDFIEGKLEVPKKIVKDPRTGDYLPAEKTEFVSFTSFYPA